MSRTATFDPFQFTRLLDELIGAIEDGAILPTIGSSRVLEHVESIEKLELIQYRSHVIPWELVWKAAALMRR
jgi:hypothetical protein